jgi:hypothetical protein
MFARQVGGAVYTTSSHRKANVWMANMVHKVGIVLTRVRRTQGRSAVAEIDQLPYNHNQSFRSWRQIR